MKFAGRVTNALRTSNNRVCTEEVDQVIYRKDKDVISGNTVAPIHFKSATAIGETPTLDETMV